MIVYLAGDIPAFVMYCVYGESGSSLLIESTDSTILADADFENLAHSKMCWEGDHLCVVLTVNDSKAVDKSIVSELSVKLRKIGCRCVLDNGRKELVHCSLPIVCYNHFCSLINDNVVILWELHMIVCSLAVPAITSMVYV